MRATKLNTILAAFAVLFLCVSAGNNTAYRMKWVILKECSVKVNGSTNVNKFSCVINGYPNADTLLLYKNNPADQAVAMSGRLELPVASFDCMNAMMTSDLRKTLKSKEFPMLHINFLSLERSPVLHPEQEAITGVVNIELAGVIKRTEVRYKISAADQKTVNLIGNQTVRFSDFNLTPPRKLGGMIRANNELDVEFRISFRLIPG